MAGLLGYISVKRQNRMARSGPARQVSFARGRVRAIKIASSRSR